MKSLFLRIFLWFWLVMVVVVGLLVVLSPTWTRVRPAFQQWEQQAYARLTQEAQRVGNLLIEQGPERLPEAVAQFGPPHRTKLYLIDEAGKDFYGQEVPEPVVGIAERSRGGGQTELERDGSSFLTARPAPAFEGGQYVLVIARGFGGHGPRRRPPRPIELLRPQALAPILALIVLVVGGLCYWLARYLTSPVAALRSATRRVTAGDLAARVGAPVARRRDEIGDLARDFDLMVERVETLVGSQRRLLRDVSHELRSPLARLEVALELARRRAGGQADEPLDRIEREARRLNDLIEQLLTLDRLETGAERPEMVPVDVAELLEGVAADAAYEARIRGRDVRLLPGPRIQVIGRRNMLRSALENVLRNAVSYTAEGTTVEVSSAITEDEGARTAVIQVRDGGPGVPEDDLEHLFEPFYRVAEARERSSGGAGLGLAITARAIRLHGGSVVARNRLEGGLIVTIRLPESGKAEQ